MANLSCPVCGSEDLEPNGAVSCFDGQRGFRCSACGAELAPLRGGIGRTALLVVPLFAVLFGVSLVVGALFLLGHELPGGQVLGFAGILAAGAGVVALQQTGREWRRPRPRRHDRAGRARPSPPAPRPVRSERFPRPARVTEPGAVIGSLPRGRNDASRESRHSNGERLCHFHLGPEGVASGLGGLFPIWFILVLVGSLIVFKDCRQDHFLYRSPFPEIITAGVTAAGSWLLGRHLNRGVPHRFLEFPRDHRDPETGTLLPGTYGHTFCFVRLEYCGLFAVLFYGCLCLRGP